MTNLSSNSWISASAISQQKNPLQIFSAAFRILYSNQIAGPYLVRLEREFNLCAGEGGEGTIYAAAAEFDRKLIQVQEPVPDNHTSSRFLKSSRFWRRCVIKRLRYDSGRDLASQITSAYSEINLLSREPFKSHPNIIRLQGWGLCLDSLENPSGLVPSLPLLILDKASWDLKRFLQSSEYEQTSYLDLCFISLGIGKGLEVLHTAGIVHGDMKLTNVLLAVTTEYTQSEDLMKCKWLPRLCDFGLATSVHAQDDYGKAPMYRGTQGWRPLEAYHDEPPESLMSCDIFAYGLIVWALFTGKPTSPLPPDWNKQEERETIIEMIGQQKVYGRASQSVLKAYGLEKGENEIYNTLRDLTERAVNFAPGYRRKGWSIKIRRKAFFEGSREERQTQVNRVLFVLKESLQDSPRSRSSQPWIFMDLYQYPEFQEPEDPAFYLSEPELMTAQAKLLSLERLNREMWAYLAVKQEILSRVVALKYRRSLRRLGNTIVTLAPSLTPRSIRQQVYEDWFSEVVFSLRSEGGLRSPDFGANDIGPFNHEDKHCYSLHGLYKLLNNSASCDILKKFQDWYHTFLAGPESALGLYDNFTISMEIQEKPWIEHEFYAFARLHSRFKLCCWEKHQRDLQCFNSREEAIRKEVSIVFAFSLLSSSQPLIWLCRGEIALMAVDSLKQHPRQLWAWLKHQGLSNTEIEKRMLLFLDLGCDIGQELYLDRRRETVFRIYIQKIKHSKSRLSVCRHFRRMAATEYVSDQYRFFLTGYSPDVQGDESPSKHNPITTALHEAVRAEAYDVVEYLVRSGFVVTVTAKDQTPLDLAVAIESRNHILRQNGNSSNLHRIIALLQQSAKPLVRGGLSHSLPIGWTAISLPKFGTAYQEDSIDSDVAALTFVKPRYGLLQDRRLALGYRKIASQNQTYYLDPIRFLKSQASKSATGTRIPYATESTFTNSWYLEDVQETRKPPAKLRQDSRRWYRMIAAIGAFIEELASTIVAWFSWIIKNLGLYSPLTFLLLLLLAFDFKVYLLNSCYRHVLPWLISAMLMSVTGQLPRPMTEVKKGQPVMIKIPQRQGRKA